MSDRISSVWYTDATFDYRTGLSVIGYCDDRCNKRSSKVIRTTDINKAEKEAINFFLKSEYAQKAFEKYSVLTIKTDSVHARDYFEGAEGFIVEYVRREENPANSVVYTHKQSIVNKPVNRRP